MRLIHRLRPLAILALIPVFGMIFWLTALLASSIPNLLVVGVNVHGLSLATYAGTSTQRVAPLSLRVLEDAQRDATGRGAPGTPATPSATVPARSPRPTPVATPTPRPTPSPTPGLPLPTPSPLPSPTPTPGAATISGQVQDSQTRLPIVAATISLSPGGASALTDASGNFSISIASASYTVTASAATYNSASQTVSVGAGQKANVIFRLVSVTAYGSLTGSVLDGATKAPVAAATVTLSNGVIRVSDLSGNFAYSIVLNGSYTLTVSALGYTTQSQVVTIKPGHTTNVQIALVH